MMGADGGTLGHSDETDLDSLFAVLDSKLAEGRITKEEHDHMLAVNQSAAMATEQPTEESQTSPMSPMSPTIGGVVTLLDTGDFKFVDEVEEDDSETPKKPSTPKQKKKRRRYPNREQAQQFLDGVVEEKYLSLKQIGRGATSTIFKAMINQPDTDTDVAESVALKRYKVRIGSGDKNEEEDLADILGEIAILKKCKHGNVLEFVEVFIEKSETLWLVTELCMCAVIDVFSSLGRSYNEAEMLGLTYQVLLGLEHIHSNRIIHRDIKCANLLMAERGTVVLADFGVSTDLSNKADDSCCTFVGSPYWIAPEVIMAMEEGTYSYPADLWSLGISIIEMSQSKPPLMDIAAMSALYQIPENDPPTLDPLKGDWKIATHDLVARCLQKTPTDRWSAPQLLKHPALSKLHAGDQGRSVVRRILAQAFTNIGMAGTITALADTLDLVDLDLADLELIEVAVPTKRNPVSIPDHERHQENSESESEVEPDSKVKESNKSRVTRTLHFVKKKILRRKKKAASAISSSHIDELPMVMSPDDGNSPVKSIGETSAYHGIQNEPLPLPVAPRPAPRAGNIKRNRGQVSQKYLGVLPSSREGAPVEDQTKLKMQMRKLREKSMKRRTTRTTNLQQSTST